MQCILCKGSGELSPKPKTAAQKAAEARKLKRKGLTHKMIAEALGWKSTHSVVKALKQV